ncbi:MAG: glycosyltransferase family A protein, partial [Candidatus Neomarinimicrobiota bacterium]
REAVNGTNEHRPTVSVIICTRDRPDDLARCLPTVLANDYPDFEVIVVDQSTTDASQRVAESLADLRLRYHRQNATGKSRALNAALAVAKGAVTAHTDDDCTVPPDWLRRAVEVLTEEPEAGIVFGAVAAAPHDGGETFLPAFRPTRYHRLQGRFARVRAQALAGANMAVRRAVFERLSGFDECLGPGSRFRSGDDDDLAYRALRAGFVVVLDPVNTIVHWGKREYADGSARQLLRNYRYGDGASFVKHLRCGDPLAAYALLREAFVEVRYLISNLIRHRRPSGAGRLLYLIMGAMRGLRQPLDHKGQRYVPTGNETAVIGDSTRHPARAAK